MSLETIGSDVRGNVDFSLPAPGQCADAALTAASVTSFTTPPGFNRAFFSYAPGTNVWVTLDGSVPVVPTTPITSTQELNPGIRQLSIQGAQTIKAISDTDGYINIRYDQGT